MSRQTVSVHLSRTVRCGTGEVVLDARASIRCSPDKDPRRFLEMLRSQCRVELDEQHRHLERELDDDRTSEGSDSSGRREVPTVQTPPGS